MTTQTVVDGVTLSAASWANDVDSTAYSVLTGVAGTNTITATGPANYSYSASRTPIWFLPANTNTGSATINITPSGASALGAKNIFRNGLALVGGELKKSQPTALIYDGTQFNIVTTGSNVVQRDLPMFIQGLVQSVNSGDAVNDTDISAGVATDSTGVYLMRLAASLTKRIDASWAVGTNQGGLDGTESAAGTPDVSTWYYIWLIARSDTGVVDALYSESATSPTMPTNYDYKRLIGAVFNNSGGDISAYHAYEIEGGGLEVNWDVPTLDVNQANALTTARRTDTVRVPVNFSTIAHLNVVITDASPTVTAWICCPDQTDAAPSLTAAPLVNITDTVTAGQGLSMHIRTSATGTIAARGSLATIDLYAVVTIGWKWARRNS